MVLACIFPKGRVFILWQDNGISFKLCLVVYFDDTVLCMLLFVGVCIKYVFFILI